MIADAILDIDLYSVHMASPSRESKENCKEKAANHVSSEEAFSAHRKALLTEEQHN